MMAARMWKIRSGVVVNNMSHPEEFQGIFYGDLITGSPTV
jgi:hypothetical protein